jgi:hypothetical protein
MESIFFTIGCLGIARGDAKKKLTKQLGLSHEEIAKRKRFNKTFVEKRNLGFNLLVQSMGMNAMYQSVISTTCEIGDLFGAWKAIWDKSMIQRNLLCRANWQQSLQIVFRCQLNRWRHFE